MARINKETIKEKKAKRLNSDNTSNFIEDGINVDNRQIHLFTEVTQESISKVIRGIQLMLVKNPELPISLYVNSYGGDVYSGFGLFDFIHSLTVEVHIYVVGTAMSSASIILMAGDIRYMYENSKIMLHSCSGGVEGKSFEIVSDAEEHKRLHRQMAELYASRSHVKAEKWVKDLKHEDMFLRADEALALGLIDKIIKRA
jgi:ATP-dependent Clp protease protease subunit